MFQRISSWWKQGLRLAAREHRVAFEVSIPYTNANEVSLRHTKVVEGEEALLRAAQAAFPSVQGLAVRCIENPNWRR